MKIVIVSATLLIMSGSCCALPAEDKSEKPVANLSVRCQILLDAQIAVRDETKKLHAAIQGNSDKKPRPEDTAAAKKLAEKQKASVADATKEVEMLKKDGAAVAFTKVFEDLLAHMKRVQKLLDVADVGAVTQTIEDDTIVVLKEMIRALKSQQEDLRELRKQLYEDRDSFGEDPELFERKIGVAVTGVAKAKTVTLFEGLPHQMFEKPALEKELKDKKTLTHHNYPFYQEAISPKDDAAKKLLELCGDSKTFERYRGAKLCGGFHPDWSMELADGKEIYSILFCFGCGEARLYGPRVDVYSDLNKEALGKIAALLEPYQKNRPKRERLKVPLPKVEK